MNFVNYCLLKGMEGCANIVKRAERKEEYLINAIGAVFLFFFLNAVATFTIEIPHWFIELKKWADSK